jgi:hypothetical protein
LSLDLSDESVCDEAELQSPTERSRRLLEPLLLETIRGMAQGIVVGEDDDGDLAPDHAAVVAEADLCTDNGHYVTVDAPDVARPSDAQAEQKCGGDALDVYSAKEGHYGVEDHDGYPHNSSHRWARGVHRLLCQL